MAEQGNPQNPAVLPVCRSKEEAKQFYDRVSKLYDCVAGAFERKYAEMALNRLAIQNGETVLEIGFGTGHCLQQIAQLVGNKGKAYGIDISPGMFKVTKKRLEKAGLIDKVELYCGDALQLPYDNETFDATFTSFTLELFDTPEIPKVLEEVRRTLKLDGRLGVVSMSKQDGQSTLLRLYEWVHKKWPKYIDCRPIYVEHSLTDARYEVRSKEKVKLFGLPGELIIATKAI